MPRYFLELSYKGTRYSGFQTQDNAHTIQSVVEDALHTLYRRPVQLTGSSRTDAGVHALQNYFHFDADWAISAKHQYNLNAILPEDISLTGLYRVADDAHSRFGAIARQYMYYIYAKKDPFLNDRAWYYPFALDEAKLHSCAAMLPGTHSFIAFSKRNTQVSNFNCQIMEAGWHRQGECLVFTIRGNRFLRGMVRALVASMLKVARGSWTEDRFSGLINSMEQSAADFSAPSHGLFLQRVAFPEGYMQVL